MEKIIFSLFFIIMIYHIIIHGNISNNYDNLIQNIKSTKTFSKKICYQTLSNLIAYLIEGNCTSSLLKINTSSYFICNTTCMEIWHGILLRFNDCQDFILYKEKIFNDVKEICKIYYENCLYRNSTLMYFENKYLNICNLYNE